MKQLKLDRFEVDMLARCLNGVDKFFGGYDHLLLTVSKLTSFPNLWRLFAEGGFVQILISLALTKSGCTQVYAVKALLNMIPEAVIDESHNETVTKSACVKPLTNQATVIVTSSLKLMEFVKSYPSTVTGVCSDLLQGIKLLTQPLDNPGEYSSERTP